MAETPFVPPTSTAYSPVFTLVRDWLGLAGLGADAPVLDSLARNIAADMCERDLAPAAYGDKRRPYYTHACAGVEGMSATLHLRDGSLELVFKDEQLDLINEEGRDLYVARLAASEVLALRQWLIDFLPASEAEIGVGHGVAPPVSVTVPAPGSEERHFWLEAAEQHGFEETSEEQLPYLALPAYASNEEGLLALMAAAREQGRKDVLDALATGSAAAEPKADREALRKALTDITDAADKLILSLPGHWHDDATIELTDAASDARTALSAAAQNDLYDVTTEAARG